MSQLNLRTRLINLVLPVAILFSVVSCEKETTPDPPNENTILGLWVGSYTTDGQSELGNQYYSLIIKPDGTLINDTEGANRQHLNTGNWSMKGDTLICTTTCVYGFPSNIGVVETHTAIFDNVTGELKNGVWKNEPPLNGSGKFIVKKIE